MSDEPPRRSPRAFDVPNGKEPPAAEPRPRRPQVLAPAAVEIEADELVQVEPAEVVEPPVQRRLGLWSVVATCASGLLGLAIVLWIERLIGRLFETAPWAGLVGLGLLVGLIAALVGLALREVFALRRLARRSDLAERAGAALAARDDAAAGRIVSDLSALLADRAETAVGREMIERSRGTVMDARDRLAHAEDALLAPIDERAIGLAAAASRRVSVVTAVAPRALIDVAYVLVENARLVRSVATVYGLRPGRFGFLRLLRDVLSHLAVTGVVSVSDGVIEQALGHGVASRVSARLGEGVLNGMLTARVGAAAIDLCRPLPFRARPHPTARDILKRVAALRSSNVR